MSSWLIGGSGKNVGVVTHALITEAMCGLDAQSEEP
jgi:hypothetical protein